MEGVAYATGIQQPMAEVEPETKRLYQRIQEANKYQSDLISQIESRLHDILNLRTPDKKEEKTGSQIPMNDFVHSLDNEIQQICIANSRLGEIRDHLKRII